MNLKDVQKKIDEMESDIAKMLFAFTNETECVIEDVYLNNISFDQVGKRKETIVGYDVRIRTYL